MCDSHSCAPLRGWGEAKLRAGHSKASISHISLSLQTATRAPWAALPAHPAQLPGPDNDPAPQQPCPSPPLHPLSRPPPFPASKHPRRHSTVPDPLLYPEQRLLWEAHNAAVIPDDQRLHIHPQVQQMQAGAWRGAPGRERPSAASPRAPGSARAESRKWDRSLEAQLCSWGSRLSSSCQCGQLLCSSKEGASECHGQRWSLGTGGPRLLGRKEVPRALAALPRGDPVVLLCCG